MEEDKRILSRAVEATLIPQGTPMELAEGENVVITHRLGGNFTVMTLQGMYRIGSKDADALGEQQEVSAVDTKFPEDQSPADENKIRENLKSVFDPEIPVNVVDLGLIYRVEIEQNEERGRMAFIDLTLTAPGCGMGPVIAEDVKSKTLELPGIDDAEVEIVWDPPWNKDMMSEAAKLELNL